jgi:Right handed beta helix region
MSIPYKKQLNQLCIYLLLVPLASLLSLQANSLDTTATLGQNMVLFTRASGQLNEQLAAAALTDEQSYKSYQLLEALRTIKSMIDKFATNTGSMNLGNLEAASKLVKEALELEAAGIPGLTIKRCCSIRVILCQIQQLINACCEALSSQLAAGIATLASDISSSTTTIITEITSKLPCAPPIPITTVPFTITASGEYCLTGNMTYTGVGGAAITVSGASDVTIQGNSFNITVTDPTASGILIENSTNVTVNNDNIIMATVTLNPAATNGGFQIVNSSQVTLIGNFTLNGQNGIVVDASTNADILNNQSNSAANAGVNILSSIGVTIERTTLLGNNLVYCLMLPATKTAE